ncbi:MAG: glycine C-acetyltransferase [Planctomycetota bacterium]|nr:glycine C-acetyltransferase [Planctomycetota bacterium]
MFDQARGHYAAALQQIHDAGLARGERLLTSPQGPVVEVEGRSLLNFCANNYLGLSDDPRVLAGARRALDERGYGLSSVRFICGTQDRHSELERRVSAFLSTEETILYGSCFDANAGLFETLLGPEDAVISDALNHASIIDGIRLCKAKRHRYTHNDLGELEAALADAAGARLRLIATDGVFSMDGDIARLDAICGLADRHKAMVMVDDSHATGILGPTGRGTPERFGVASRVDLVTSTLGKALGGAAGGWISGRRELVDLLRQRSRPYLFSNSLSPVIVGASLAVLDLLESSGELRDRLASNTRRFRDGTTKAGLSIRPGEHPIVPIMLGDARLAAEFARRSFARGVLVVGFAFPVVPEGQARVRVQVSAAHTPAQIDQALEAFAAVARELALPAHV